MKPLASGDPTSVGPFRLVGVLGAGGMGRVYLGQSLAGRRVAIKVIRAELAEDPGFRLRFAREVSAARLVSPLYTAAVVDADPEAELPWLATTYIEGPSLEDRVRQSGPMTPAAVLTLGVGLAEALASIHAVGLVHRDLKPSNVLIHDSGPHIIDFGIALADGVPRMTTSLVVGTPSYMAPERIHGSEAGPAGDIFSLGATLVFAATGRSLVQDGTMYAQIMQITVGRFDLSDLPAQLRPLVVRCTSRRPDDRPTADELTRILAASGVAAPAPGWHTSTAEAPEVRLPTLGLRMSRRTVLSVAGVAVAAGVAGTATWRLWPRRPELSTHMLWRRSIGRSAPDDPPAPGGSSRIAVFGGRIITVSDGTVRAIDSHGTALWSRPLSATPISLQRWNAALVAFDESQLWLLDPSDGRVVAQTDAVERELRTATADDVEGVPVRIRGLTVARDNAYVSVGTAMLALRRDLSLQWRAPRPDAVGSRRPPVGVPVVANSRALIASEVDESTVDFNDYDGQSGASGWTARFARTPDPDPGRPPPRDRPPPPKPDDDRDGGPPDRHEPRDRSEGRMAGELIVLRSAHQIHALIASTGELSWQLDFDEHLAGLEVADRFALFSADNVRIHALSTGQPVANLPQRDAVIAAVRMDRVLAASGESVTLLEAPQTVIWNDRLPESLSQALPDQITVENDVAYVVFRPRPDLGAPEYEVAAFWL